MYITVTIVKPLNIEIKILFGEVRTLLQTQKVRPKYYALFISVTIVKSLYGHETPSLLLD